MGYDKPTITVVDLNCGVSIGVYSTSPYKEASVPCAPSTPSFLFTTHPYFRVLNIREGGGKNKNQQYLNPASRSKGRDGLPHGVGWGGYEEQGEGGFR